MSQKLGVPPKDLADAALRRETAQMWLTRQETVIGGSSHAMATHTRRMLELEQEYVARFADETRPNPARTRRGARARSGQPPIRR
jgi:hypothetical protein